MSAGKKYIKKKIFHMDKDRVKEASKKWEMSHSFHYYHFFFKEKNQETLIGVNHLPGYSFCQLGKDIISQILLDQRRSFWGNTFLWLEAGVINGLVIKADRGTEC